VRYDHRRRCAKTARDAIRRAHQFWYQCAPAFRAESRSRTIDAERGNDQSEMIDDWRRDCHQSWLELVDGHRESLMPHPGEFSIKLSS